MSEAGPFLISINEGGRLGNHLLSFSWLIAMARMTGGAALNPGFARYKNHFQNTAGQKIPSWPGNAPVGPGFVSAVNFCQKFPLRLYRRFRAVHQLRMDEFSPLLRNISPLRRRFGYVTFDWLVDGRHKAKPIGPTAKYPDGSPGFFTPSLVSYIRSKKYVVVDSAALIPTVPASVVPCVRDYLRFNAKIESEADGWLRANVPGDRIAIGVHIRQGDFKTWQGGHAFVEPAVIADLLRRFQQSIPQDPMFVICSDEPLDAGLFKDLPFKFGPDDFLVTMATLARCRYLLGTGSSSFSGWASFAGAVPLWQVTKTNNSITPKLSDFSVYATEAASNL